VSTFHFRNVLSSRSCSVPTTWLAIPGPTLETHACRHLCYGKVLASSSLQTQFCIISSTRRAKTTLRKVPRYDFQTKMSICCCFLTSHFNVRGSSLLPFWNGGRLQETSGITVKGMSLSCLGEGFAHSMLLLAMHRHSKTSLLKFLQRRYAILHFQAQSFKKTTR
jgi:hypothetical protein